MYFPGNCAFLAILTSRECYFPEIATSQEIWLPRKFDIPWNVTSRCYFTRKYDFPENINSWEIWFPRKFNFPGNLTFWEIKTFWEIWLPGKFDFLRYVTPGKCYFLRNMTSRKKYLLVRVAPDKVNYRDQWLPWFKWQVWYNANIWIFRHKYVWHMWQVWPQVTSVINGDKCDLMWHVWPYVTRCSTNTGHLSNLAAGPLDEFHLVFTRGKVHMKITTVLIKYAPRHHATTLSFLQFLLEGHV